MFDNQLSIINVGILIHQLDPSINITSFKDINDLGIYLNATFNTNIIKGMGWNDVFNELERAINNQKYKNAMISI